MASWDGASLGTSRFLSQRAPWPEESCQGKEPVLKEMLCFWKDWKLELNFTTFEDSSNVFFFNVGSCLLFISCPTSREAEEILHFTIKLIELSWISKAHGFVSDIRNVVSDIKVLENKRIYKSPFPIDSILVSLRTKSGGRGKVLFCVGSLPDFTSFLPFKNTLTVCCINRVVLLGN